MKWRQRVKTDFLLAKPPYRAKTTGDALKVLLLPFWKIPDMVNPRYIQGGDHLYGKPVENLVFAVRGLSSKNYTNAHQSLRRIPLFNTILQVIREWDVEAINREMTILQREPRGRGFSDMGPLVVAILKPLYKLSRLNPHVHLLPAIAKMYEFAKMYLTNSEERAMLLRYYTIAREELPLVFTQLRQRLYPVLLKLLSDKFIDLDQFFLDKEEEILALLGLKEEDLVRDVPDHTLGAEIVTTGPEDPEIVITPKLARHGFKLLDQLFPRAGWNALDEIPDLFSYFQTVFEFPKGSDLIPIDDAIQVIQPLSEVLQQLFYGFQNIQWGTVVNQDGEVIRLQEELDKAIARWHFFHEEFFGKNYLPLLQEYCREVERSGPLANEAKRREHQLLWFKRNYLLPHLVLPVMDDVRVKSLGYPNLAIQVKEMLDRLTPVAIEVDQKGIRSSSVLNPETRVRFPVISMVSLRFQNALRRSEIGPLGEKRLLDQGNNKSLLFYTVALLSALDHLLSAPNSLLYTRNSTYLYRTSGQPGDDKPVYNAPKKNSANLLKKLNEQPPADVAVQPWQTQVGDLYGPFIAAEEIKAQIFSYHEDKQPFVLVAFRVWPPEAAAGFLDFAEPFLDQGTHLQSQDDGTWFYVMKDTLEEEAEDFARKLLSAAARRVPPLAMGAIIVPFSISWTLNKMLLAPSRGWLAAKTIPPQILGLWIETAQTFEFRGDVPTVVVVPAVEEADTDLPEPEKNQNMNP